MKSVEHNLLVQLFCTCKASVMKHCCCFCFDRCHELLVCFERKLFKHNIFPSLCMGSQPYQIEIYRDIAQCASPLFHSSPLSRIPTFKS